MSTSFAPLALKSGMYLRFKSLLQHKMEILKETVFLHYRNETHKKCPICQTKLNSTDDSWVLSELPRTDEVNEKIVTELNALTNGSTSEANTHPHVDEDNDEDDD